MTENSASEEDKRNPRWQRLDEAIRHWDRHANRTVGGWLDIICGIDRHTLSALCLPTLLCALLVLASPSLPRLGLAAVTGVTVAVVLLVVMRHSAAKKQPLAVDLWAQIIAVLVVVAVICFVGGDRL